MPSERFPTITEIVTLKTGATKTMLDRPVVDNLPISRDAVAPGPRDYAWRADTPATLVWLEAAEGSLAKLKGAVADRVMTLPAPFAGEPTTLLELPNMHMGSRGKSIRWGNAHLAIISVSRFSDRKTMMLAFRSFFRSGEDHGALSGFLTRASYHSPRRGSGNFDRRQASAGAHPRWLGHLLLVPGASRGGDKPFVATMPVTGGEEKILWRSADPYYADPVALLDGGKVLIRRESQTESPNYFTASLTGDAAPTQVTQFNSPYKDIALPSKQVLHYKRADGLDLTATLWLPAGYDKSKGPLPTLMEAYPAEFKDRAAASQVTGSPNRFPRISWASPVFFTQTGYAVLENAAIPIIGEGTQEPNDTYNEQLVAGAKAAVDEGVKLGVVDPKRVAVMGHSYGAFMTANLLAHSTLFRAGIARSGAYNRTLTPYGFQNEERTYWQAPNVYHDMSPFSFADKIKSPILLIHGEADDNTGTYPIQSERFYAALKGQGATVRLVFLPLEAHSYEARESLEHMLWEMDRWMDTYVKPETPPVR